MKKRWFIIAGSVLAVILVAVIIATVNKPAKEVENIDEAIDEAQGQEEMIDYGNGIGFDEEVDGAELTFAPSDVTNYYGTWKATSDQALYLYGKVELTINEDKTWTGVVVDEDESGTWEFDGTSMKVESEFFNVTLQFTEDGTMIMQEDREGTGDYINTVLTKQ